MEPKNKLPTVHPIMIYPIKVLFIFFAEHQKDSPTELAFKYAVFRINKDKEVLPNNSLTYDVQYVPNEDSFRTTKKVRL